MRTTHGFSAVWPNTQTLPALFNSLAGGMDAARSALKPKATFQGKIPFVYKCNARNASVLRQHGWSIMHLSDDAMIAPQNFDLNTPALRTLRRKLRAAKKNGVSLHTNSVMDWHTLHKNDQEWQDTHGIARGGTMRRFEMGYLSDQFIARAEYEGKTCAFVTFEKAILNGASISCDTHHKCLMTLCIASSITRLLQQKRWVSNALVLRQHLHAPTQTAAFSDWPHDVP